MAVFSDSLILQKEEIQFLLDLLPKSQSRAPDIYIIEKWETIRALTNQNNDLYAKYNLLKNIIHSSIFSTYNYKHCKIFIYLFNLPYKDPFLIKLHGVFCLFHEIRHHQQFVLDPKNLLSHMETLQLNKKPSYSLSWVEKDANHHAVKWMRKNKKVINEKFEIKALHWDVGVNENNRLRIIAN